MTANELDRFILTLPAERPLRVVRLPSRYAVDSETGTIKDRAEKEVDSLEWKTPAGLWEHLMSVPRGPIYKYRHPEYHTEKGVHHISLHGLFNKLVKRRLINPKHRYLFV